MSFADDTKFAAFIERDNWLPMVTRDAVASALEGFALPVQPDRDMDWLAMAVRRSLASSMRNISDGSERTSNAEIRAELERLASLAGSTWLELFQCDHAVDSRLWDIGWHPRNGEGERSDFDRFKDAVAELDWLASFLRQAARKTESQHGPWRQSERKRLRIERGQYLAPVFEVTFGHPVTANNWPSDARHATPTPFMDFYQRMVAIAFGEQATQDLPGVLKAACQHHRELPARFAEGIIPGL